MMTGIQGELRDRILGSTAHIYVQRDVGIADYRAEVQNLLEVPGVLGAAPAIIGKALISSEDGNSFITLKGIDPQLEPEVTDIGRTMQSGSVEGVEASDG